MKPKKAPNDLALRTARIEATLRHSELADRERLVLHAYHHFEAMHGGACGKPGLCWPTDGELGAYLGRSDITTRRARRWLAAPGEGLAPFIAVTYVPPFHKLPNGQTSAHGANVIALLEIAGGPVAGTAPSPDVLELAEADAEVRRLEAQLASARRRMQKAAGGLAASRSAAARRRTSHNAPWENTPEWSLLLPGNQNGEGEGRGEAIVTQAA